MVKVVDVVDVFVLVLVVVVWQKWGPTPEGKVHGLQVDAHLPVLGFSFR